MPWEVSSVLERRIRFVLDVERGELPLTAVCEAHGISRTTGYKWLERHASWGISGLSDRPRTPGRLARAMAPEIASAIVAARTRYPHWGPKKLRAWLLREQPEGRLAGGIDDGRSAAPAWFERAAAWSAARAGADAAVRGGADAARFVVHRFQGAGFARWTGNVATL
ncbi:MAG: leucine zipper domain-containing protein [Rhodospirillales bacterium]